MTITKADVTETATIKMMDIVALAFISVPYSLSFNKYPNSERKKESNYRAS
jgi:hypothetical protein